MARGKTIGILGGMGPLATADLYRKIIEATPASRDQEHLHVIIDADPSIPERTTALLHGGPDPTPLLIAGARRLAAAGVDFIIVPCNTAHAFLPRVAEAVPVPFVSMIEETAREVAGCIGPDQAAGVLASAGTVATGLYQQALERFRRGALVPSEATQQGVTAAIAAVKAATALAMPAAEELIGQGARVLLAACTELPLILSQSVVPDPEVRLIDPTGVLARAAVRRALADEEPGEPGQSREQEKAGAHVVGH
jgi:aspartate racemase